VPVKGVTAQESLTMVLRFNAPLRATKPNSDLVEQHMESFRGRIIPFIRKEYGDLGEDELAAELEKWKRNLLSVFPRKRFSSKRGEVEQVAIPSTWVMGAIRARAATMKMRLGTAIVEGIEVKPHLIGLWCRDGPLTPDKLTFVTDTIISSDKFGKRSALKIYETANPPCITEKIHIAIHHPGVKPETVAELLTFGRMGANRTQGYGTFHGTVYNGVRKRWVGE
jgi:hypothetical protein